MAILVDWQIRSLAHSGKLLDPFSESVQDGGVISYGLTHCGYDLRLGGTVLVFKNTHQQIISPKRAKEPGFMERVFDRFENLQPGCAVVIPPHSYILGYSLEYIRMPSDLKGRCVGKSSLARCGVLANTTPLEPGWHGHLTLEIANITPCPVEVYVAEGIAQLEFETLAGEPETDYAQKNGKYQGQQAEPVIGKVKG